MAAMEKRQKADCRCAAASVRRSKPDFYGICADNTGPAPVLGAQPAIVRVDFLAAQMLALITGTTSLEIDTDRHEIRLHILDASQTETTLAAIRRDFVAPLRALSRATP